MAGPSMMTYDLPRHANAILMKSDPSWEYDALGADRIGSKRR